MRVVLAPDSFKGTLSATRAAAALSAGWRSVRPGDDTVAVPMADGGEGTLDVLAGAAPDRRSSLVTAPDGRHVRAQWLMRAEGTAVAELAQASGLTLLGRPDPLGAHTYGSGEVLAAALDAGARRVVLALGGSASTDGGTGLLAALGARFLDAEGADVPLGGGSLGRLARIDLSALRQPPEHGVDVLVDVRTTLLGPSGCAATFGPQKGATQADVAALDAALRRLHELLGGDADQPGCGAAGGTAYGLATAWGARLVPGAPAVAAWVDLAGAVAQADLVITGEGRFDASSRDGKVVGHVLEVAASAGVACCVVAGELAVPTACSLSLVELAGGRDAARARPARWIAEAGRVLATRRAG